MASIGFQFKQFFVQHNQCAMRVGTDGVLLGAWAVTPILRSSKHTALSNGFSSQTNNDCTPRILDVGTGTGLIALMMAQRYPTASIDALEVDDAASIQASSNIQQCPWPERITLIHQSFQDYVSRTVGRKYDAITCNPPFYIDSMKCPDERRTLARHSDNLSPHDLLNGARHLLKTTGQLSIILPTDMVPLYEAEAAISGLLLTRLTTIRTVAHKAPKRALMAFSPVRLQSPDITEQTLMDNDNQRTAWYQNLTQDFYIR